MSSFTGLIPFFGQSGPVVAGYMANLMEERDFELINDKLKLISKCGDVVELRAVAYRVAKRLTNRYKEQLSRLCSKDSAEKLAEFVNQYIVSAVVNQNIATFRFQKANDQDSLVEMLLTLGVHQIQFQSNPIPEFD